VSNEKAGGGGGETGWGLARPGFARAPARVGLGFWKNLQDEDVVLLQLAHHALRKIRQHGKLLLR
jgi:hypothetical protein